MVQAGPSLDSRILRAAAAFVWLATGLGVLHPAYRAEGLPHLDALGLSPWVMFVTCAGEVVLGLRVLLGPASGWVTALQTGLIATFTVILGVEDPRLLVHPFGVLSKNVPLVAVIVAAWLLEREGWTPRASWLLRGGLAFIWVWEGLIANFLFQDEALLEVVRAAPLPAGDVGLLLTVGGIGEALGGVAILVLRGRLLWWLLALQAVGLLVICVLVTNYDPMQWLGPFGPLTKNIPLLAATLVLLRRTT